MLHVYIKSSTHWCRTTKSYKLPVISVVIGKKGGQVKCFLFQKIIYGHSLEIGHCWAIESIPRLMSPWTVDGWHGRVSIMKRVSLGSQCPENYCMNGGYCSVLFTGTYYCTCPEMTSGDRCETYNGLLKYIHTYVRSRVIKLSLCFSIGSVPTTWWWW